MAGFLESYPRKMFCLDQEVDSMVDGDMAWKSLQYSNVQSLSAIIYHSLSRKSCPFREYFHLHLFKRPKCAKFERLKGIYSISFLNLQICLYQLSLLLGGELFGGRIVNKVGLMLLSKVVWELLLRLTSLWEDILWAEAQGAVDQWSCSSLC